MPSLNMTQFNHVLKMGLDSQNRRYAQELEETPVHQDTGFTVGGRPIGIDYIKSVIDAVGPAKFLRLNPWAVDLIRKKSDIETKFRKTLDSAWTSLIGERVAHGWTADQVANDIKGENERRRKLGLDRQRRTRPSEFDYTPSNIGILNTMFKYGKDSKPHPRHWEKRGLKKNLATTD